jgi:hypothetical protein
MSKWERGDFELGRGTEVVLKGAREPSRITFRTEQR